MDPTHFDTMTRSLTEASSRRGVLTRLAGAALAAAAVQIPGLAGAKKKRKKPSRNSYGCLNVGQACAGNSNNCCSGICEGKKPKKGKKDRSRCVSHDVGICTPGRNICTEGVQPATTCGDNCFCMRSTGNAGFCGDGLNDNFQCADCDRDKDCEAQGFPLGSACVVADGQTCGCNAVGSSTACVAPCGTA